MQVVTTLVSEMCMHNAVHNMNEAIKACIRKNWGSHVLVWRLYSLDTMDDPDMQDFAALPAYTLYFHFRACNFAG